MFSDGVKLLEEGDAKAALHEFEKSLADARGDQKADSLYNIAICHCRLDNTDAAVEAVVEAVTIDPGLATEIRRDDDLAPLARNERFQAALAAAERHDTESGRDPGSVATHGAQDTQEARVAPAPPDDARAVGLKEYSDQDLDAVSQSETPTLFAFPWGNRTEPVSVVSTIAAQPPFDTRFSFATVSASNSPKLVAQSGIRILPAIALLLRGKPLFILSGVEEVNLGQAVRACERVIAILDSPDSGPELEKMEAFARQSAGTASKRNSSENWLMAVPFSGLFTGVVMGVSRANMSGPAWLLPTGAAYAFLIINGNMGFSEAQRFVATALALIVGAYGRDILEFFFAQP